MAKYSPLTFFRPLLPCRLSLLLTALLLFQFTSVAFGESQFETLSESAAMRRCPVESSRPIPSAILNAVKSSADVQTKNTYIVPLHIHVLQDSQGTNPTSPDTIGAMVARLNSGFSRAGFVFQIQSIETVVNDSWAQIPKKNRSVLDEISVALNVGSRDSANVYIHLLEGLCGIASLPYAEDQYEALYLDYRCIPGGEESDAYDTVIHEMGHFLGLLHTFAPEPNGCRGKGDYVSDTPFQKTAHFQCKRYDTCPKKSGLDAVRNYMDYTGDSCGHRFTRGQIALMRYSHAYYRLGIL